MSEIRSLLIGEGPNDESLIYHLTWLLELLLPDDDIQQTQFVRPESLGGIPRGDLAGRIHKTLADYESQCDILFIHRDADGRDHTPRVQEIALVVTNIPLPRPHFVPVIPIQATESWLMFNAQVLFQAVGKKQHTELDLPPLSRIETLHDPKARFLALLRAAYGETGRKASKFHPGHSNYYASVARIIYEETAEKFSPLLAQQNNVTAFQRVHATLASALIPAPEP